MPLYPQDNRGAGKAAGIASPQLRPRLAFQGLLRALVAVPEHVAQDVGLVVELAQMLELEAQHQGAVGPQIEGEIFDKGFDVAGGQNEALVGVLELELILDALPG